MANLLCSSTCGELGTPPKSFEVLCVKSAKKQFGFRYLGFVARDLVLGDPTDLTEWCQAATDAFIAISPCGKIDLGTPSFTQSSDTNNCGETEVLETIYQPTFSTYSSDPEGLTHCAYYEALVNNSCLNVILFDCDGNAYITPEYRDYVNGVTTDAPIGNPGYEYSLIQSPYPTNGEGNKEVWNFQLEIKLDGQQILCPVKLPGLQECLLDQLAA